LEGLIAQLNSLTSANEESGEAVSKLDKIVKDYNEDLAETKARYAITNDEMVKWKSIIHAATEAMVALRVEGLENTIAYADLEAELKKASENFEKLNKTTEENEDATKTITDINKEYEQTLKKINAELKVNGDEEKALEAKISATMGAMVALVLIGEEASDEYEELSEGVKKYAEELEELNEDVDDSTRALTFQEARLEELAEKFHVATEAVEENKDAIAEWIDENKDSLNQMTIGLNSLASTWDSLNEVQKNQHEAELARLKDEGASEEELAETKKQFAREDLKRKKAARTFQATIDTASAVVGFLADPGGIPGVVLSGLAGIAGIAQVAAIQSEPLPSFDIGSIRIPQTQQAVVHENEMILPAPMAQQAREEGISISPASGSGQPIHLMIYLDGRMIGENTVKGINAGQYGKIEARVVK
jgi:chromosome segregation ATPase